MKTMKTMIAFVMCIVAGVLLAVSFMTEAARSQPVTQKFSVEGVERTAIIVPNSALTPKEGSPLIFIFHGHGGNAHNSFQRFEVHKHWLEAVVVYMQGLPTATGRDPKGERPGWQNAPGLHGDRDLKFFDAVLDWAKKTYKIDSNRVYAGGHSNGGGMTYALWAARSNIIAAFAPSASVFGSKSLTAKPKPALLIIGKDDDIVPTENQERSAESVLRLNQCETTGKEVAPNVKLHKSKAGADTAVYIHNGGHRMPNNTGEMMVRFFKEHRLK
ncbi:MAG: alpha/beta hydrolase family esterase [Blastocatellia bacterium]